MANFERCNVCNHLMLGGQCFFCQLEDMQQYLNSNKKCTRCGHRLIKGECYHCKLNRSLTNFENQVNRANEMREDTNQMGQRMQNNQPLTYCKTPGCFTKLRGSNRYLGICAKCKAKRGYYR